MGRMEKEKVCPTTSTQQTQTTHFFFFYLFKVVEFNYTNSEIPIPTPFEFETNKQQVKVYSSREDHSPHGVPLKGSSVLSPLSSDRCETKPNRVLELDIGMTLRTLLEDGKGVPLVPIRFITRRGSVTSSYYNDGILAKVSVFNSL